MKLGHKLAILTSVSVTLLLLLTPARGRAEQFEKFGDVVVRYSALSADQLPAAMAKAYGFERSSRTGLLNIAVQKGEGDAEHAIPATIKARATTLMGRAVEVSVREIKEEGTVYYLGQFAIPGNDTLRFTLDVTPGGATAPLTLTFNKDYVTD